MDAQLDDLRRQLSADPEDEEALARLARGLVQRGQLTEAYGLLFDHDAVKKRSPLVLEVGALLAAGERKVLEDLNEGTRFAVERPEETSEDEVDGWSWLSLEETGLPVLALKFPFGSEPALEGLACCSLLRFLDLTETEITDGDLAYLSSLTALESLELLGTKITDEGLVHLSTLTSLRSLRLSRTEITDEGLAHLSGLTSLRYLKLWGTKITDAGLVHLSALTSLESLELGGTPVCQDPVRHLHALRYCRGQEHQHGPDEPPIRGTRGGAEA